MSTISENLTFFRLELPQEVTLVAVSKTYPAEVVREAYDAGQRVFGENRVQELVPKHEALPKDIQWHLIGHLQSNKVKYIAPFVSMIHSVDSLKLLQEIDKEAAKNDRIISVLLQFHIATEETKFGLNVEEAQLLLRSDAFRQMMHVQVEGVMGMATFSENTGLVRSEFRNLKAIFQQLKSEFFSESNVFKYISMGMSSDYRIAIEEGSTMIRIGSSIFGSRS